MHLTASKAGLLTQPSIWHWHMCNHAPSLHQNLRRYPFHLRCFLIRRLNLQALSIWFAMRRRIAYIWAIWRMSDRSTTYLWSLIALPWDVSILLLRHQNALYLFTIPSFGDNLVGLRSTVLCSELVQGHEGTVWVCACSGHKSWFPRRNMSRRLSNFIRTTRNPADQLHVQVVLQR